MGCEAYLFGKTQLIFPFPYTNNKKSKIYSYFRIQKLKYMYVGCKSKENSDINHVQKGNDSVSESGLLNNQVVAPLTRRLTLG